MSRLSRGRSMIARGTQRLAERLVLGVDERGVGGDFDAGRIGRGAQDGIRTDDVRAGQQNALDDG